MLRLVFLTTTLYALAGAPAAAQSLSLAGPAGTAQVLDVAGLTALPMETIEVRDHDGTVQVFRGPSLRRLATMAGAPEGRALRGRDIMTAIVAEAADGYRTGYMVAEIDEQFGNRRAIVALSQDGQPLPAADGPLRIVLEGEQHRARWIRQLVSIRIVRLSP